MGKKHTSIRIEEEYLEVLRKHGIKLSPLIDEYLRGYVEILNSSEKELNEERKRLKENIDRDKTSLKDINSRLMKLYEEEL